MTIDNRRIATARLVPLLLAFSFLVAACGQSAAPSATVTPPPTAAPPTATTAPSPTAAPTSTPVPEVDLAIDLPDGDPERGKVLAIQLTCAICHGTHGPGLGAAPGLPRIMERGELRIADPAYEGNASTIREYLIESILLPKVYVVPGDWPVSMPTDFGDRLTDQDLADILAWLDTVE
jgi:mono/diheme cytochrome c family protein